MKPRNEKPPLCAVCALPKKGKPREREDLGEHTAPWLAGRPVCDGCMRRVGRPRQEQAAA